MALDIKVLNVKDHLGLPGQEPTFVVFTGGLDAPALECGQLKVEPGVSEVLGKPDLDIFEVQSWSIVVEVVKLEVVVHQAKQSPEVPLLHWL